MKPLIKTILIVAGLTFGEVSVYADDIDSLGIDPRWKITGEYDLTTPESQLKVTFFAPDSTPARSNIKIIIEHSVYDSLHSKFITTCDSLVPVYIDETGTYLAHITPGFYTLTFIHSVWGSVCMFPVGIKLLSYKGTTMTVHFTKGPKECPDGLVDKPVIYLYPTKKTEVDIKLNVNGTLELTYPAYNNGWKVTASPNGDLSCNGNIYKYLFWDAAIHSNLNSVLNTGFLVHRDSLLGFFENKLTEMNLSSAEQQDFITYWVPRMKKNELNFIHFSFNADNNKIAAYQISPVPDSFFRVYMTWYNHQGNKYQQPLIPQKIEKCNRTGFTVVEWGGSEFAVVSE